MILNRFSRPRLPGMVEENPSISHKLPYIYKDKKTFQLLFEEAMTRWVSGTCHVAEKVTWRDFKARVLGGVHGIIQAQGARKSLALFTSGVPSPWWFRRPWG